MGHLLHIYLFCANIGKRKAKRWLKTAKNVINFDIFIFDLVFSIQIKFFQYKLFNAIWLFVDSMELSISVYSNILGLKLAKSDQF